MTARIEFYRSDLIGKSCRRAGMISWDCSCPASEEKSEAGYGMSYTDAACSLWWTLWKNNYEVFAADGWTSNDRFGLGLQTANTATILGSYCLFEASNVLDDLSEPKDICASRTSACWKPAHAKCKEIRL
ncbi:hypothetical protein ABIB00_007961 [Bradyrhizobium sp. LB14.3]|uniref:hypothetical protein n=1 Tax=Bradyrhizobium sp. LB14.3 TaxID=3156328 RepID=UPI0033979DDC